MLWNAFFNNNNLIRVSLEQPAAGYDWEDVATEPKRLQIGHGWVRSMCTLKGEREEVRDHSNHLTLKLEKP